MAEESSDDHMSLQCDPASSPEVQGQGVYGEGAANMLHLTFPANCQAERLWIGRIVLCEFLGLAVDITFDRTQTTRISAYGKTLQLSDAFLAGAAKEWLAPLISPKIGLPCWNVAASGLAPRLVEPSVPALFGSGEFYMMDNRSATLGLDVFGAAFFMLSRYEEAASSVRDQHGRFPAAASLAYQGGFLQRPIIDEYVEILWTAMQRLWPNLHRRERHARTLVSCDVDHPYHPGAASLYRAGKSTLAAVFRGRRAAIWPLKNYFSSRHGDWRHDPYYHTVDWMMDVNERADSKVAFYFIPENTDRHMDDTCSLRDPAVADMMRRIARRGHEIGLHPGYNTFDSGSRIARAKNLLQTALDKAGVIQPVLGGRQHYLRWSTRTPAYWDAAGIQYDSTLSYPEQAGFRCGTCHEYPMYDLHRRRPLRLRQRPLICMEASVFRYMGYGVSFAALEQMEKLRSAAYRVDGQFTLLWHNSSLDTAPARSLYCQVIAGPQRAGAGPRANSHAMVPQ